jgi:BlaI family transcriptional regulator, penicillinase repressor
MMKSKPVSPRSCSISDAEWKIMKLLWRKSPQPAYDLAQDLARTDQWKPRMVKTLLNRLLRKGAVGYQTYKNLYLYSPRVLEEECVKDESESFLQRVFDGSLSLMLVHYARHRKLTSSEIAALKKLMNEQER